MDAQNLYITCYKSLIKYSAYGQVIASYSFTETMPNALTLLDDGSLLVVSENIRDIHTIHHISEDLQQGYELKLDGKGVRFIGVDPVNHRIYVIDNSRWRFTIKVYCLQKQSRTRFPSFEADEKFASFEAGMKLPSLEADEELASLIAEINMTCHQSEEKVTVLK